jgi:preprotein translocase subunit YajC
MSFILLQAPPTSNPLLQFLPLVLIFGIFYFLLFLPMQRQKKKQQQMLGNLKSGDIVITNGGVVGTVVTLNDDDTIILRVKPDNVKLQFARGSVASLVEPKS